MSNKNSISIFERVIIMLFGVAVVLLGLYPLSREYDGIDGFIKSKAQRFSDLFKEVDNKLDRARLSEERNAPRSTKKAFVDDVSKKKEVDKIDNKDRQELDSLIDKVWQ